MKPLDYMIYRARHSATTVSLSSLFLLSALFAASGAFQPEILPEYYTSREQLLGTVFLLILIPVFLIIFLIVSQRRSMRSGQQLFDDGICDHEPEQWLRPMNARVRLIGAGLGLIYAVVANTPLQWWTDFFGSNPLTRSIVIGQATLWTLVGLTLSYRLHTALSFYKLGRTVELDLLEMRKIKPFANNGVDDVLAIAILLVLSTIQGLDAQFRFENYAAAMLIAVPAAGFLFLLPMLTIHRRLVRIRAEYLNEMNQQISAAPREMTSDGIQRFETLLQHRDRISDAPTWPIDWRIYSRLAFYVILPPITWIGAAFVELGVDRFLGDG